MLLAGISYTTFPEFSVGPLTIRSFGLLVGIGILLGSWIAARYVEQFGVPREETYRLATRMVVAGLIGSRVTWVLSHLDQIDSPIDLIAVWEGGIQFSGGFIAAILIGFPTFRSWSPKLRWRSLDGYAYGLTIGLAIGRVGCYSVGEHFGRTTDFFLGSTYQGGNTQENFIGDERLVAGMTFHNTAFYEGLHLVVLFGLLSMVRYRAAAADRELAPGTLMGIFAVWYGLGRFVTDGLRVNDARVLGVTGAQMTMLGLFFVGLYVLFVLRKRTAAMPDDVAEVEAIQAKVLERAGVSVTGGAGAADPADPADPVPAQDETDGPDETSDAGDLAPDDAAPGDADPDTQG